jgi:hypothetical protein
MYSERLAALNLQALELRRLGFDITFYYKVINNQTPFDVDIVLTIYTISPMSTFKNRLYINILFTKDMVALKQFNYTVGLAIELYR